MCSTCKQVIVCLHCRKEEREKVIQIKERKRKKNSRNVKDAKNLKNMINFCDSRNVTIIAVCGADGRAV